MNRPAPHPSWRRGSRSGDSREARRKAGRSVGGFERREDVRRESAALGHLVPIRARPLADRSRLLAIGSGAAARARSPRLSVTVKVLPNPSSLSTVIAPPCSTTSSFASARPIPVPGWFAAVVGTVKAVEDPAEVGRRDAGTAVANGDAAPSVSSP